MKYSSRQVECPRCGGDGTLSYVSGKYMRGARLARGVGLREVARRLGLTPSYISDLELDRRPISREMADLMFKAFK